MNRKLLALFLVLCLVLPLLPVHALAEDETPTDTDELDASKFTATSTTYTDFSGVAFPSGAVYAGNSAKTNSGAIQLRSKNSNSGIVTTTSGGKIRKISVTWDDASTSGSLEIYGKNTAYTDAADLYINSEKGQQIESISCGDNSEFSIDNDYEYIGLRSKSGAIYITKIVIIWETDGTLPEPTATPEPTPEPPTKTYSLITSESELISGSTYLIANTAVSGEAYVASKQNNNNRGAYQTTVATDKTITLNGIATSSEDSLAFEFVLGGDAESGWSFYDPVTDGYLYAPGTGNHLKTINSAPTDGSWLFDIVFSDDTPSVTCKADVTQKNMRYNPNNGSPIFSCYADSSSIKNPVYLYKLVDNTEPPVTEPAFDNCSVVLSGQIGMNFYMTIPEGYEAGTLNVTIGERPITAEGVLQEDGRYKYTCYLTSVEMAEQITATYSYTVGEETKTINRITSIQGYLAELIGNNEYSAAHALAKAIWNYGYYAQLAVADGPNHNAMDSTYIADANLPSSITGFAVTATLNPASVQSATYSLTLDTETALNIYLTLAEGYEMSADKVSVSCSDNKVDFEYAVEKVGNRYRVKITGIAAHELGAAFTVTTGDTSITASAMSYVQKCLASTTANENTKNAAAALYRYYQEAIAYAGGAGE